MKLKKREITLNEADSLQDVFYLEHSLMQAYGEGEHFAFRKEVKNELEGLQKAASGVMQEMEKLWRKAKSEQL